MTPAELAELERLAVEEVWACLYGLEEFQPEPDLEPTEPFQPEDSVRIG